MEQTRPVTRRPLFRQLLLLQLLLVVLMVGAIGWVSAVQADETFRSRESRRLLATAESVASEAVVRGTLHSRPEFETSMKERLERVRVAADASYVVLVDTDDSVRAENLPLEGGRRYAIRADVRNGGSWAGTGQRYGRKAIETQVAVLGDQTYKPPGVALGYLVLGRFYPSRVEVLRSAIPNALLYFAIAGAIGAVGSLLIARRVKRQTLGLEPREITALVEQREAMLHGVREGVLGVDNEGRVSFANDEAVELLAVSALLDRRVAELEVPPEVHAVLGGQKTVEDRVVAVGTRLLVLNTQPILVRRRTTGWVTSMRDRTQLLGLQQELAAAHAGTDTLRAQVHEFRNRLHAIAGMAELGKVDQVREFVSSVMTDLDGRVGQVTSRVEDPAVAALLVAKASRAAELGVAFTLSEDSHLPAQAMDMSADLVTVVGNLVDNAFEAVDVAGRVSVDLRQEGNRIVVEVSDTGHGIATEDLGRVFEQGWTTKTGADSRSHGFGLALTRMACRRHGGSVTVAQREGAVLRAELYADEVAHA